MGHDDGSHDGDMEDFDGEPPPSRHSTLDPNYLAPEFWGANDEDFEGSEGSYLTTPGDEEEAFKAREEDPILREIKATLIKLVLEDYLAQNSNNGFRTHAGQGAAGGTQAGGRQPTEPQTPNRNPRGNKRKRGQNDDGNEGGEDGTKEPPQRPPSSKKGYGNTRLLACPYYKRDPLRYSDLNTDPNERVYRHCCTVVIEAQGHRLKQHLER